ncbi:hypothetical protein J2Y69_001382 [Microbacterium resistens]|uniref:DUF2178 domain-containing protein n=1 Tax=Microbacterium resistens TaxID=156977 RepID=A0ABU1SD03_9MICO|nr:hypothetical protein [Microbacterium resistens]MDR6866783.1 hypothetical protein [Microbacterium resistens]
MVYHERTAWAGLLSSVLAVGAYVVLLFAAAGGGPLTEVDWLPLMLWTIGGGIVLSIVIAIVWGAVVGVRDRDAATASDIRDRDISRMGARVEHAFLVIAGLVVILLCAVRADLFWIANTMFAGFAVSAFIGGIARVIAYRRGLV